MAKKTPKKDATFAFVDVENMRNSAQAFGYEDFDYEKLHELLAVKKGVSRIYLYVAIEKGDEEKREYFEGLRNLKNFYVEIKEVVEYKKKNVLTRNECPSCKHRFIKEIPLNGRKKGNCDAELTLDIIRCGVMKKYKKMIAFSGDGDFARVYEYVATKLNKEVTVYAPSGKILGKRTSLKIKDLAKQGVIQLESTNTLFQHYGKKPVTSQEG